MPAPLPQARLDDRQRLACLRLIRSDNVGPATFRALINHFGGAETALAALPELARRGGGRAPRICTADRAEAELARAAKVGAQPIFTIEPGYPPLLAEIEPPPPMLYVRGRLELMTRPMVAIVGARDGSAAGQTLARRFAIALGRAGYVVASGLARGIDGAAHEAAMATGTVAVLAGGIDVVYPPEHADLHARIGVAGCLVTEMPPGFTPRGQDFPRRNRIISGVSFGVLVVEAARRSGTLITARMAAEQGREVFAIPGHPLDPRAEGTNHLLKTGAILVTEAEDIITALAPMHAPTLPLPMRTEVQALEAPPAAAAPHPPTLLSGASVAERVWSALGAAPVDIDVLGRATGFPAREIQVALLELDLAGRLTRHSRHLVSRAIEEGGPH